MELFPILEKTFSTEQKKAGEAQEMAYLIAFGPIVFQVGRLMVKFGILEMLRDQEKGLTQDEIAERTGLSQYAVKVLMEAALCIGLVLVDTETDRFALSKTGWFLLTDPAIRVNIDFNHDVNYEGWFHLEEALKEGKPAGLAHFGEWSTIYQGLSQLPKHVQKSWFGFDHFYSDHSFDQALEVVFAEHPMTLLDVGGNTGRWALHCVNYNQDVKVTILDLPQQIELMRQNINGKKGSERIDGCGINLLDDSQQFPTDKHYDVIWMSQFLDCFSENEMLSIISRAAKIMDGNSRLLIMETFWDRQKYPTAAFALTMTSLYFTALANGNSKMYHSADLKGVVAKAGLKVERIIDGLGYGHSIMICKREF